MYFLSQSRPTIRINHRKLYFDTFVIRLQERYNKGPIDYIVTIIYKFLKLKEHWFQ